MIKSYHQIPKYEIVYLNNKKKKFCLIIPVINEGKNILNLLSKIYKLKLSKKIDIIVIDGGSNDNSLIEKNLKLNSIRGLLIMRDEGKLSSQLRCAYSFALKDGYNGFVTIDGNNKDNPKSVLEFIKYLEKGFDFVQASRFISKGRGINTPLSRNFAIKFIHVPLINFFSNFNWTDTTQGFRGYSRRIFEDKAISPFRKIFNSYELLSYLSYQVPRLGYKCIEIPTTRKYPKVGLPSKIVSIKSHILLLKILIYTCLGVYNPK